MLSGRRGAHRELTRAAADADPEADAVPLLPLSHAQPSSSDARAVSSEYDHRFALGDEADDIDDNVDDDYDDDYDNEMDAGACGRRRFQQHTLDPDADNTDPPTSKLRVAYASSPPRDVGETTEPTSSHHTYPPSLSTSAPAIACPIGVGTLAPNPDQEHDQDRLALHDKIPPLPPSYYDAMRPVPSKGFAASLAEFRREFREHMSGMPQYVPDCIRVATTAIRFRIKQAIWFLIPRSRLAHMTYTVAALWLLVIFTGPVFEATSNTSRSSNSPWDWAGSPANRQPPQPYQGDGDVVQNASWAHRGCVTEADASSWSWFTWCHALTELYIPLTGPEVSGSLYFLVDPPPPMEPIPGSHQRATRNAQSRKRGSAPSESPPHPQAQDASPPLADRDDRGTARGTLRIVEYAPNPSMGEKYVSAARVTIKAKYLIAAEDYFATSTVAHLSRNGGEQGVGIYTRPPPSHRGRSLEDRESGRRPPLMFDITVSVPKGSTLNGINVTTSAMDVILFDTLTSVSPTWRRSGQEKSSRFLTEGGEDGEKTSIRSIRKDRSDPFPLRHSDLESRDFAVQAISEKAFSEAYAKDLVVSSGMGFIGIGNKFGRPLVLRDRLSLSSDQNSVALAGQVQAPQIDLSSNQGTIRLLPKSQTWATGGTGSVRLTSHESIILMHNSQVRGMHLTVEAAALQVHTHGKGPGFWIPEKTFNMNAREDSEAHVSLLHDPANDEPLDLQAYTRRGDLSFTLAHVPVGKQVKTQISSSRGSTEIYLGPTFLGRVYLREGAKNSTGIDPIVSTKPSKTNQKTKASGEKGKGDPSKTQPDTDLAPSEELLPQLKTPRVLETISDPTPPPSPLHSPGAGEGMESQANWTVSGALLWRPVGQGENPSLLAKQTNGSYIMATGARGSHVHFL